VTGPIQKSVVNQNGIAFTGHTEWLAERTKTDRVVMMLVDGGLGVALVTTHLPLSEVPGAITVEAVQATIAQTLKTLSEDFGLKTPRISVCGLNPHAGEAGYLGREEIDIITPVIETFKSRGALIQGPMPADTAFTKQALQNVDAVIAMYHDQGLPVLKHSGFGHAVNVTLGLPIVRTSVDHGTALDLAGSGRADPGSLLAAIHLADRMVRT
jgi:4-hydroxythreonine-4-phosphate dehydrogenase